jgi:hypothetical protein
VGAVVLLAARNYHVIRASDGMHLIPKVDETFADTYVDIRHFGLRDWQDHGAVFAAITQADRTDLMETAAHDALNTGLNRLLGGPDARR